MKPSETDPSELFERVIDVNRRIAEAARRSGRPPGEIRLCAVTKNVPAARVREAYDTGLSLFGENRVQEAAAKIPETPAAIEWHMIGHLQTNKARDVVGLFSCVQSVDSERVAAALHRRLEPTGALLPVLIEVNCSGEPSKFGVAPESLATLVETTACLSRLQLRGLMTIGPLSPDPSDARAAFARLRGLRDETETRLGCRLPELSMGMSGDYEIAVEEGATIVRIGSAIFGERRP